MEMLYCSQCGRQFIEDDLIRFGSTMVCAECKPTFIQRLREGVTVTGEMDYGGFWIRAGAAIIDGIIMGVANTLIGFISGLLIAFMAGRSENTVAMFMGVGVINFIISLALSVGYVTYFLGKFGATPGKMACGLKVVRPDGDKISYARACGRFFASYLSAMILGIGFLMVAFDDEKRALHDRICDTRVVRKA